MPTTFLHTAAPAGGALPMLDAQDLRRWRDCPRQQWLYRHEGLPALPELLEQPGAGGGSAKGRSRPAPPRGLPSLATRDLDLPEVQPVLRSSYPGAPWLVQPHTEAEWAEALAQTQALMASPALAEPGAALLGACVAGQDGSRARIEVLQRGPLGWRLFKLRLATAGNEADVDEVAWWAHVAAHAGWRIASVGMLLVNTDFVYPGHGLYAGLLREVDLGPTLGSRPVAEWLVGLRQTEQGPLPAPALGAPCAADGGCVYLERCHGREPGPAPQDPRHSLEIVGRDLAEQLRIEGCRTLLDVPEGRLSDPRHRRAWAAVRQDAPVLDPAVAAITRALPGPRHLLRLETIGAAVPLWTGLRAYDALPFQWSCATEAPDGQWRAQFFLGDGSVDPRRAFAESLLAELADGGAVLAYNAGFERNRLRELARRFEDLAPALEALVARIVDLFQLGRAHFYHPAMAGSWSAKSLYSAVAPEAGAHSPLLPGVPAPQDALAQLLTPATPPARRAELLAALQEHGQRQLQALQTLLAMFDHAGESA